MEVGVDRQYARDLAAMALEERVWTSSTERVGVWVAILCFCR